MRSRLLIPVLLSVALAAQAPPAVKIALQVDPPKDGVPALDTAAIMKELGGLAKDAGLMEPAPGGDGWILEIRAVPMKLHDGLLIADTPMRLSRLRSGQKVVEEAKDGEAVTAAMKQEDLDGHAGKDIAARARTLLEAAKVIPPIPVPKLTLPAAPGTGKVEDFDFSVIKVASMPPQPPYPPAARMNRVQGTVVVEVVIGTDGLPVTVSALEGPGPLLAYSLEYAMKWRFVPARLHGKAEWARFKMNLNYRLR